ncbi:hypothetical protein D3C75_1182520 [compost metagenome]
MLNASCAACNMVCCKVRRVSTSAGSASLMPDWVEVLIRPALWFWSLCMSMTLPRAPMAPRVRSTWLLALPRLAMVEATVLSKLRCAAASPWTGVSSAWRNWLRVSSTFWVW